MVYYLFIGFNKDYVWGEILYNILTEPVTPWKQSG